MAPPVQERMAERLAHQRRTGQVRACRQAVAGEVRALMGRFQVSQTTLGRAIGVGQSGLSRRLNADVAFDVDDLYAIASYFDVPITAVIPSNIASSVSTGSDAA